MSNKRDNCIILLIEAPDPENINPELVAAFGVERAAHINLDLLQTAYKLAKSFSAATLFLSFAKSPRHQDLTWLDGDDPGFLEAKGGDLGGRLTDAFRLAFYTGAKKVLLLNHLSPGVKTAYLSQTFDSVTEKTVALGMNQDGSIYILGLTQNNLRLLDGLNLSSPKAADEVSIKAKKNSLSVFSLPEAFAVTSEELLRKWLDAGDSNPSLFLKVPTPPVDSAALPAAPRQGEKKHRRGHKTALPPPLLPDTEQKPL
ncbi:MAG: DUF2064 domain-containing protein [Elusimicrobiota bacterium]